MEEDDFEALFSGLRKVGFDAEASWDERAERFGAAQEHERVRSADRVTELLARIGFLPAPEVFDTFDVLDVGGGAGRHARVFAPRASGVTVADISSKMLAVAEKNLRALGIENVAYVKVDWEAADLAALGWEKRFDLVFASACPAVMSRRGLAKMSAASRGRCCVVQSVAAHDEIGRRLREALGVFSTRDVRNDRNAVAGVFNLVWLAGLNPEIRYLEFEGENAFTREELFARYADTFRDLVRRDRAAFENTLHNLFPHEPVRGLERATLAVITWRV